MLFPAPVRKIYEKNAKDQVDIWKSDLELLHARKKQFIKNYPNDDFDHILEELFNKYMESKSIVDNMPTTSDQVWDTVKQGYEEVWCQAAPKFYKIKSRL
ncbi:MAG: hypothetical protein WD431_00410 [Cyclobacteriaceae bacterium]